MKEPQARDFVYFIETEHLAKGHFYRVEDEKTWKRVVGCQYKKFVIKEGLHWKKFYHAVCLLSYKGKLLTTKNIERALKEVENPEWFENLKQNR